VEQIWLPFLCSDTELCRRTVLLCFKDLLMFHPYKEFRACTCFLKAVLRQEPNVVMHIGQQTVPQSAILKLTNNDSTHSVKSQCHLAASVENIVSQVISVFTTLTSRPILKQKYNKISVNPFYGISEFLIIATCNPYRIHININKFTLFNYYTYTCSELC